MLRRILAFASLSLITLPAAALAQSPRSQSASSHSTLILSQYYPVGSYEFEQAQRRQEHRWRCERIREELRENRYSYTPEELHRRWEHYHEQCDEGYSYWSY